MDVPDYTKRIFYYDSLRAFAIITIISCHVAGAYNFDYIFNLPDLSILYFDAISFFNHSSQIGVPIFVILSGALLINKTDSLKKFFKKRFNRVVIPFLFWALIYILVEIFFFNKVDLNLFFNIFTATSRTNGHIFWFVWRIITVYCLIFLFNKILSFFNPNNQKILINVFLILFVIYCLLITFNVFTLISDRLVYYFSFFGYAVFGYWLDNIDLNNSKYYKFFKFTPLKIVVLSFIISV